MVLPIGRTDGAMEKPSTGGVQKQEESREMNKEEGERDGEEGERERERDVEEGERDGEEEERDGREGERNKEEGERSGTEGEMNGNGGSEKGEMKEKEKQDDNEEEKPREKTVLMPQEHPAHHHNDVAHPTKLPSSPPEVSLVPKLLAFSQLYVPSKNPAHRPPPRRPKPGLSSSAFHSRPPAPRHGTFYSEPVPDLPLSETASVTSPTLTSYLFPLPLISLPYTPDSSFVCNLLEILTPKMCQGFQNQDFNQMGEVPSEVSQVRKSMGNIQQHAETMRIEFLKKLHKVHGHIATIMFWTLFT